MKTDAKKLATDFYMKVGQKRFNEVGQYLHENIEFKGPLAQSIGKDAYLAAVTNFGKIFISSKIRETMAEDDKVILLIDYDMPPPIGHFPSVAYLTVKEGLISKIELFYDAQHFVQKRDEIFNQKS